MFYNNNTHEHEHEHKHTEVEQHILYFWIYINFLKTRGGGETNTITDKIKIMQCDTAIYE